MRDAGEQGRRERARAQAGQDGRRLLSVIRGRLHRRGRGAEPGEPDDDYIEIDPARARRDVFSVPGWLRDVGLMSWLLVGVALLVAGAVALAALTQVIVVPVLVGGDRRRGRLAAGRLDGRAIGVPRGIGAALLMLALIAIGIGVFLVIVLRDHRRGRGRRRAPRATPRTRSPAGSRTWALDPSKAESAKDQASSGGQRRRLGAARRRGQRDQRSSRRSPSSSR